MRWNGPARARTTSSATAMATSASSSSAMATATPAMSSRPPPAANCAGGPRRRYYCVYAAGKDIWCYQAAGGTDADRDRACAEATWRSLHWGGNYVVREHRGDLIRTAGTAFRGKIVGTASCPGHVPDTAACARRVLGASQAVRFCAIDAFDVVTVR
jgi:hypothetical protein